MARADVQPVWQSCIRQLGNDFLPLTFDITDLEATKQALNQRPEGWQAVDLLVNNAGLALGLELPTKLI